MTKRTDDAAAVSQAKGSVHEAVGKLIGDDAVRAEGMAKQAEAAPATSETTKSPQD